MASNLLPAEGSVGWAAAVLNAISAPQLNGFRSTLTSGTPVTTSDVTGATTIYLSPYTGNRISLYDGTNWAVFGSAEISLALGTLSSGVNYDVFVYDNAGTLAIDTLVAWTNDTARATALVRQDGVWVKSGATTRRYVGTIRMTSTTTTEDSAQKRFVWNVDNRVMRVGFKRDGTASWNYASTGFQGFNGNDADWKFEIVQGLNEQPVSAHLQCYVAAVGSASWSFVAIGLDSQSTADTTNAQAGSVLASTTGGETALTNYEKLIGLGYHYLNALNATGGGTSTFFGGGSYSGMRVTVWG